MRTLATLTLTLLASLQAPGAATPRTFEPRHRTAAELLPRAEALLAPTGGLVVLDAGRNALLLVGEKQAVSEALEVLAASDVAPRTVSLRHESVRRSELAQRGLTVEWTVALGRVRAGNVRPAGAATRMTARVEAGSARTKDSTVATVRVLEGTWARIKAGETVPVRTGARIGLTTLLVRAETGIEARPTVLPDGHVQVEVIPFHGDVGPDGRLVTADAATTLRVPPGETVVLGGLERSLDETVSGADGRTRRAGTDELLLLLTVQVEP